MKSIQFESCNVHFDTSNSETFEEPRTAHGFMRKDGTITMCFELDEDEMLNINKSHHLWLSIMTNKETMQPIYMTTLPPADLPEKYWPKMAPSFEMLRVKVKDNTEEIKDKISTPAQIKAIELFKLLNDEDVSVPEFTEELSKLFDE